MRIIMHIIYIRIKYAAKMVNDFFFIDHLYICMFEFAPI